MKHIQKTINKQIIFSGITLHGGKISKINLMPAEINHGIVFKRIDLKKSVSIKANWKNIKSANLCTVLHDENGQIISTVEHLMFAFYALGITNVLIEVNGDEIPILDGSSIIFINEIKKIGVKKQNKEVQKLKIFSNYQIKDKNKFIRFIPSQDLKLKIEYILDYNDNLIRKQKKIINDIKKNYLDVAKARTFCHQDDLEKIFAMGLAKGGSLDNAIVISGSKVLNQEGLRYKDEFVRHKILDCVGDLYLSEFFLSGKIFCKGGGHELTSRLLKKIFSNKNNYSLEKL